MLLAVSALELVAIGVVLEVGSTRGFGRRLGDAVVQSHAGAGSARCRGRCCGRDHSRRRRPQVWMRAASGRARPDGYWCCAGSRSRAGLWPMHDRGRRSGPAHWINRTPGHRLTVWSVVGEVAVFMAAFSLGEWLCAGGSGARRGAAIGAAPVLGSTPGCGRYLPLLRALACRKCINHRPTTGWPRGRR